MKYILLLIAFIGLSSFQITTEEQKIQKLIDFVAEIKGAVLIRNGSEYLPVKGATHLKMKREKAGSDIKTAQEFIEQLASRSSVSGKDYEIKYKNGKVVKLGDLLLAELKRI